MQIAGRHQCERRGLRSWLAARFELLVVGALTLSVLVLPGPAAADDDLVAYSVWNASPLTVDKAEDGTLHVIDLATGESTPIGPVGFLDVWALAFSPAGILYGIDEATDALVTIDPATGEGATVGPLGIDTIGAGLTFDCEGRLWMSTSEPGDIVNEDTVDAPGVALYRIDPDTGTATEVGPHGQWILGLAARDVTIVGSGGDDDRQNLVVLDTTTGTATEVVQSEAASGLDFAPDGRLWGIQFGTASPPASEDVNPAEGHLFVIDAETGSTEYKAPVRRGFAALAIPGGPLCGTDASGPDVTAVGGSQLATGSEDPVSGQRPAPQQGAAEPPRSSRPGVDNGSVEDQGSTGSDSRWSVADRSPTGHGVSTIGDERAIRAAGAGDESGRPASPLARVTSSSGVQAGFVAGLVIGLGFVAVRGFRRLL